MQNILNSIKSLYPGATLFTSLAVICLMGLQTATGKSLKIENQTNATLSELTITSKDGGETKTFVLARDLQAGAQIQAQVPRGICLVDVQGIYDDQSRTDAEDLDLCQRNHLRLVQ